jgi:hypothetical protein
MVLGLVIDVTLDFGFVGLADGKDAVPFLPAK